MRAEVKRAKELLPARLPTQARQALKIVASSTWGCSTLSWARAARPRAMPASTLRSRAMQQS
eukprot:3189408-Pleurochrysis_carterae.AAC.1